MKINKNEDYNKRGEKKMVISLGEILTLSRMWKVKYIVSKHENDHSKMYTKKQSQSQYKN